MFKDGRHGATAFAVAIGLALIAPASALAGHDLVIYKQEAHLDLSADEATSSVSCNHGDYALDGMWRIDHADQDDYVGPLPLISGAVDVIQAEATSDRTYTFSFLKNAIGRAQVKLFVTCLAGKTSGGAHQHSFVGAFAKSDGTPLAPNTLQSQSTPVLGIANPNPNVTAVTAPTCQSGYRLVSPGFHADSFSTPDPPAGIMRLVESISTTGLDWSWKFENSALPAAGTMNVTTSWRCLQVKVPPTGHDKHKLTFRFTNPKTFKPLPKRVSEGQYNCGDMYKAVVAGFSIPFVDFAGGDQSSYDQTGNGLIDPPTSLNAFNNVYFLGMDPRPKQRAYSFVNRRAFGGFVVTLKALCLNYRTT